MEKEIKPEVISAIPLLWTVLKIIAVIKIVF